MVEKNHMTAERRSGMERRELPPPCIQPCKPIADELAKRNEEIIKRWDASREALEKGDKVIGDKLHKIFECLDRKVPSKLFYWVMGGVISAGAFFSVVVVGGTLWNLSDKMNAMATDIKVMSVTVENTAIDLKAHNTKSEHKFAVHEERLDAIEKGEVYYNFRDREKDKFNFKIKE